LTGYISHLVSSCQSRQTFSVECGRNSRKILTALTFSTVLRARSDIELYLLLEDCIGGTPTSTEEIRRDVLSENQSNNWDLLLELLNI